MIVITGASGGIGNFLYRKYRDMGETVVGTCYSNRNDAGLYLLDIGDYAQVQIFAEQLFSEDKIVLINCSAINYNIFLHKSCPDKWMEVINTNLGGSYNLIRAFLPYMRTHRFGRIINFSSVVAQLPTCGVSAYAASKSALWGLAKCIAAENASLGITINNINLGYANIGMGINTVPETMQHTLLDRLPSKTFCEPEDIFNTVEFIRNTPYINGAAIDVNGALI